MNKLLGLFREQLTSLLLFSIFASIVWLYGPLLKLGEMMPLQHPLARLCWLLAAGCAIAIIRIQTNNIPMPTDPSIADEVKTLQGRFTGALSFLRNTRTNQQEKSNLSELPWFLCIGPTASGKSSLFAESGLSFLLSKQQKKVTPTRSCDWWVTRDAVFLDVAGNYLSSSSQARVLWQALLFLFKKHLVAEAVQGIVITFNSKNLLQRDTAEIEQQADELRRALHDLYKVFRYTIPVYLVITQCDQIAGFTEFFNDLSQEELAQIWGMHLNEQEQTTEKTLLECSMAEFDRLTKRLNNRVLRQLHHEHNHDKHELIKTFPLQFEAMRETLECLLQKIENSVNKYAGLRLQGIYFSSATQANETIDIITNNVNTAFNLTPVLSEANSAPKQSKSYFINDLFRHVTYHQPKLNLQTTQMKVASMLFRSSSIINTSIAISLTAFFLYSYQTKLANINAPNANITVYKALTENQINHTDIHQILIALTSLEKATDQINQIELPLASRLIHGDASKLKQEANEAFHIALQEKLIKKIFQLIKFELSNSEKPEILYSTLQAYLTFNGNTPNNPEHLLTWITRHWSKANELNSGEMQQLGHFLQLTRQQKIHPIQLDEELIGKARSKLSQLTPYKLARAIINSKIVYAGATDLIPGDMIAQLGPGILNYNGIQQTIPGLYTRAALEKLTPAGIRAASQAALSGDDTLGRHHNYIVTSNDIEQLSRLLQDSYISEYIAQWKIFLSHTALNSPTTLNRVNGLLLQLTSHKSPISRLLDIIEYHTHAKNHSTIAQAIQQEFDFIAFTRQQLSKDYQSLHTLQQQLQTLAEQQQPERAAFQLSKNRMLAKDPDALSKLKQQAKLLPTPFSVWLTNLSDQTWQLLLNQTQHYINRQWQATVYYSYQTRLNNRYPLFKFAKQDIGLTDFNNFFAPNGQLTQFFKHYLAAFVDTKAKNWHAIKKDGHSLAIHPATLDQLKRGFIIQQTFFDSQNQPHLNFSLTAMALMPIVKSFSLNLSGQQATFRHGDNKTMRYSWAQSNNPFVEINFKSINGKNSNAKYSGPWAWFKLLDKANLQQGDDVKSYSLIFDLDGNAARFNLATEQVINPFNPQLMNGFRAPELIG